MPKQKGDSTQRSEGKRGDFTAEAQRGKRGRSRKGLNTGSEKSIPTNHKSRITNHGRAKRDSTQRHGGTKVRGEGRRYFLAKNARNKEPVPLFFRFLPLLLLCRVMSDE